MRDAQRNVARTRAARVTRGGLLDITNMVQGELNRSTLAPVLQRSQVGETLFQVRILRRELKRSQHVSASFKQVALYVELCR